MGRGAVPRGLVELAGGRRVMGGVVSTGRVEPTLYLRWRVGREVTEIPVGRRCLRLHFLHASMFTPYAEGSAGTHVLRYADGTSARLYRRTWENPHPDDESVSFDLRAVVAGTVPIAVAVTLE